MQFNPREFIDEKIGFLRREIGGEMAIVALSGGVDSSVTAVLGFKAVGKNLRAVFLEDGFMRIGEAEKISRVFRNLGINVDVHNVQREFLTALKGIRDAEEKRKAFRDTFYKTFSRIAGQAGAKIILQGTIAADIVETAGGVKTQHNVLEQIGINPLEKYGFKIVEPLKELYKNQVRMVARELGLPDEIVNRRPFPGPGLAIRILGEVTEEKLSIIKKATAIVDDELEDVECFQAFPVLLEGRATGLDRDSTRKYGYMIALRIVESEDAITAKYVRLDWTKLDGVRDMIIRNIPEVSRVLYDISDKPPATIEFE
ncbi:MAG: glutamine-hydrolyzing GMP synthase subunit GuaA [Candidatus Brockarchaeota archaeon]|nr:glutamine-hydrolyzing GMP synthase subunit GuaA [Candidatus Brockarchaeota archaeon]MBO3809179.1 glutamine-hydrolyzing GMP synthase subunit GuaA [Candidatus Brockarchaeota archaeon]